MTTQPYTSITPTATSANKIPLLAGTLTKILLLVSVTMLTMASAAHAGTYVIDNCPSAPVPNTDPGPWVIAGGTQQSKASCSGGASDWIGPRGITMNANSFDGVQLTVPSGSGLTIREAKVWWSVPHQTSGAENFAIAYANGGEVGSSKNPPEWTLAPDIIPLPSTTTTLKLTDYCSNSDATQPCVFASLAPNLELYGSQLTLADSHLPSGKTTGGGLTSTSALTGTQSLAYEAQDPDTGVRAVRMLIDGQTLAGNDYIADCPYTNFLACPASQSDTINWNTATVTDGQHTIQAIIEDAAQNTSSIYDSTITTHNAPTETSLPAIITAGQLTVGATLSTQPGSWSNPTGAGNLAYGYEWQDCDAQGNNCLTIPGAQNPTYTPAPSDIGHTLRVTVHAGNNDGIGVATSIASSVVLSSSGSLGAGHGPGTSNGGLGTSTNSNGLTSFAGVPNGAPAAQSAVIHLGISHSITRPFAERAVKITGRLTDSQGHPITGATLDVLQQTSGNNTPRLLKHAKTNASGAFTAAVPQGPSRHITIAYRAFADEPAYATTTTVVETVAAGIRLNIAPHNTSPTGTILLKGRVSGPIPHQGTSIEPLVHYHGKWIPLTTSFHTNRQGSFHVAYKFQGAVGRFPVWVKVPSGQAGFPYGRGYSNIVYVTTQ
jgi:hypothetical protein